MSKRYIVMCIPTNDGPGGYWFVYDTVNRRSKEYRTGSEAARACRLLNEGGAK